MSAVAAAPGGSRRFSIEAFTESKRARLAFGIGLVVVVLAAVVIIISSFTGKFTNIENVKGELSGASNTVPSGSLVLYRNVTVGKVGSEGLGNNGNIATTFELYPGQAAHVPSNVQALISPLSIFGNQGVDLVVPNGQAPAQTHVTTSTFIPADTETASSSLQETTTQLYNLLNAVHPAELDTALTAFATALNGEGKNLGQALVDTDNYLKAMNPHLATLNQDVGLLSPVSSQLNSAAPNIIGTLANNTVTGSTITQHADDLSSLLVQGSGAVNQLGHLFDAVQVTLPNLLNASGPTLNDISANPHLFSETLSGLGTFASAVAAAESHGPYLTVNANLPVYNTEAAVEAALSQGEGAQLVQYLAQALGASNFNPPTYTSANCPRYAGEQSHCGGGSPAVDNVGTPTNSSAASRVSTTSATSPSAADQATAQQDADQALANPAAAEESAADDIASALDGGQDPALPAEADMVLVPLYNSMAGS